MRLWFASGVVSLVLSSAAALVACGSRTDMLDDGPPVVLTPDSSVFDQRTADVRKPPPDVQQPDVPYIPKAQKCVRDGGAPTAFVGDLDASFDANHPRSAQTITLGGPTLTLPVFVPITFPTDDLRNEEEDFIDSVGCTDYWRTIASDYGVGQAIAGPHVRLTEAAPSTIDDNQIQTWLGMKIKSDPSFPQPDSNTLYVIFYPEGTQITLQGELSCQAFGGYHNSAHVQNRDVPYAVVPNCGGFEKLSGIDAITGTTSHELIEAVTDPIPEHNPAYGLPEPDALGWVLAGGGEVGDMCEFKQDAFFVPQSYPFWVQRTWTNKSGFTLNDPCQPSLPGPFFNAAARVLDQLTVDVGLGPQPARGVKLPLGQNTTVDVFAFSTGVVPSWSLSVYDSAQLRGQQPELTLSLSKTMVNNGDLVHLSITRKRQGPYGVSAFGLVSFDGQRQSFSWHLVGD
jgi:hypothetical protein